MSKSNFLFYALSVAASLLQGCDPAVETRKISKMSTDAIEGIDVQSYAVSIVPDMENSVIEGYQTTRFRKVDPSQDALKLNGRGISIVSAKLEGQAITIARLEDELVVPLPKTAQRNEILELEIQYKATPERGYTSNNTVVFTEYFACDWMICRQNAFGDKSSMTLEINLPREMETLGPDQIEKSETQPGGSYRVTWREAVPYSPYLYAFAAGDFTVSEQQVDGTTLRFLSPTAGAAELRALFAPTADMLAFFESKAGVGIPQPVYSQLYVEGRHAQEAASHSIIGSRYLEPILKTPQEGWVIAHELAHQWWGNSITCKNLSHFWLNEGLTVFMVAAWKEERWGAEAYDQEMSLAGRRYEYAKTENFDVPVSFDGEYPNRRIRAAIQYSKGALFFGELRRQLGDDAFWAGLQFYTKSNMGKTVVSRDLQNAFEQSSGQDLDELFDAWVYLGQP